MRKTKIVGTLGPATDNEKTLIKLIKAGLNCVRLNLSHGTFEEHYKTFLLVKKVREELNVPVSIMIDNKGPEIRIKKFVNDKVLLKKGAQFVLTTEDVLGDDHRVSITLATFPTLVSVKTRILINDGLIELVVEQVMSDNVVCKVVTGGIISNNKSINLPDLDLHWDYIKDSNTDELDFAAKCGADYLAMSFVSTAKDVCDVREYLKKKKAKDIKIIAKIENDIGVKNINEILDAADGVMVARGDLGVEVEFQKIPAIQKDIINKANEKGKVVITATQMLESMIENARPTRAEISDIANAVIDGTSAVMLSGETAVGKFPVESVSTMANIASEAEKNIDFEKLFLEKDFGKVNISGSIAFATVASSFSSKCKAIIVTTLSGTTAINISDLRPKCCIIACTPDVKTYNQLALGFGIVPILTEKAENVKELFELGKRSALNFKLVKKGDRVVQTVGIPKKMNTTNQLKIDTI